MDCTGVEVDLSHAAERRSECSGTSESLSAVPGSAPQTNKAYVSGVLLLTDGKGTVQSTLEDSLTVPTELTISATKARSAILW